MSGNLDMTVMHAMHNALRRDLEQIAKVTARVDDDPRRILASAVGWTISRRPCTPTTAPRTTRYGR